MTSATRVGDPALRELLKIFHGELLGPADPGNITAATETADGFDREREWVRRFWADLEPHATGVYVNFLMDEGPSQVRQAYGPAKLERLRALKQHYDPDNVFRLNQNLPPALEER